MQHTARRRFGQNFLTDASVIDRIISVIGPRENDLIIEIGPGHGAITRPLVESGAQVHAVEIDRDLARNLSDAHDRPSNLVVHSQDALNIRFGALSEDRDFRIVGNLPYNISTPILFHVLAQSQAPIDLHLMLQTEVVNRIVAPPGDRRFGRLSVMVQNLCQSSALFDIPADCFTPRPKVSSTFLRLIPRKEPIAQSEPALFESVVKAAFSMRRKTLRNALRGVLKSEQIEAAGIDPGLRAEQLDVGEFDALAQQVKASG